MYRTMTPKNEEGIIFSDEDNDDYDGQEADTFAYPSTDNGPCDIISDESEVYTECAK